MKPFNPQNAIEIYLELQSHLPPGVNVRRLGESAVIAWETGTKLGLKPGEDWSEILESLLSPVGGVFEFLDIEPPAQQ